MNEENVGKVFNMTGGAGSGGIKLEMISITRAPNKTTYKSGELFDPTGMVVTAMYAYGLSSDVTGYQWSPTVMTDDISEVTITYTEGRTTKTVITPVTVLKALASLDITHQPTKTTYEYLESFDNTGLKVDAVYTDRSRTELRADQYSYSSDAFATLGEQAVTLSYTEDGITKTVDQTVTVEAIELQVPEQKNVPTYDGTAKTVEWNDDYDNTKMNVTGDTTGTNAKTNYATTFTLIYGYKFPNGETSAEVNWAINRQPIEALPQQVNIPAYDGGVKNAEWDDNYDPNKMTVSGDQYGTAIGEYTVTFLPGSNYQWWDGSTGPKDAHWQIVDLKVSIPSQVNAPTYDGTDKTPTWENFDEENSTVSVSPATNAGEHDAVFTLTRGVWSDGTTAPKTIKWTIKRSPTAVLPQQAGSLTFDGNPQTPSWDDNYDTIKMSLNVVPKTNAGDTYGADFTPTSNYAWTDESVDTKTAIWSIGRATLSAVPEQTNVPTYDKSEKIPTWNGYSEAEGKMTMAGTTSETNAGTHNVVFTPTANYKWWDGTTEGKSASWVINKAQLTIPEGTVTEFTYDGDPHEPTVTGYASDTMERTGDTLKTGAGESYTVSYDLKDPDNYEWTDGTTETKTVEWKINKAKLTIPSGTVTEFTYDESPHEPTVINYQSNTMDRSGDTTGTNANESYTLRYDITDKANYEWSDGTSETKTVNWKIKRANSSVSLNKTTISLDTTTTSDTITVTKTGDGEIQASSSDESIATVSVSGNVVTVTGIATGSANISIWMAQGMNYLRSETMVVSAGVQFRPVLNDYTWTEISNIAKTGQGSNYFEVGDCKQIHIQGTVGTLSLNTDLCVYIIGFNHNGSTGIDFGAFKSALTNGRDVCLVDDISKRDILQSGTKAFNMNHWGSKDAPYTPNYGGWKGCDLRYDILGSTKQAPSGYGSIPTTSRVGYDAASNTATSPVANTLMAALPSDLRAVMKPMTIYTDNKGYVSANNANVTASVDYLPLLAEYEIFGTTSTFVNSYEKNHQAQYAYYSAGNSKIKYKHNNTSSAVNWWERSPSPSTDLPSSFTMLYGNNASAHWAYFSHGLSPIFRV